MNILLVESITAGAFDRPVASELLVEAEWMVGAMVSPLFPLTMVGAGSPELCVMRRGDLAPRWHRYETLVAPGDWERSWREVLLWADVVWLTAPEAEGDLLRLSREVEAAGCALLGPSSEAVAVAGSKRATHAALLGRIAQAEVRAVDAEGEWSSATGWVLKPDLGAGGMGVRRLADDALGALRDGLTADSVLQPFVEGEPLSLSVLSHAGEARVVSVNRQRIDWDEAGFARYRGGIANALPERERFQPMADAVQAAIPGLKGYWGIDCVLPAEGEPVLIEVNPRPTTSSVFLQRAIGLNVGKTVLALQAGGELPQARAGLAVAFQVPELESEPVVGVAADPAPDPSAGEI